MYRSPIWMRPRDAETNTRSAVTPQWVVTASRPKLRELYERFGFQFHSFREVGPYYVARYLYPLMESPGQ